MSNSRYQLIIQLFLLAIAIFTLTRIGLTVLIFLELDTSLVSLARIFLTGFIYDCAFLSFALILPTIYLLTLPERIWRWSGNRYFIHTIVFITIYALGFIAVAEYLFWEEFQVRFNFISVDYLIYRQEVTDNISESYPLPLLLSGILLFTLAVYSLNFKYIDSTVQREESFLGRLKYAICFLLLPLISYLFVNQDLHNTSANSYQNELASNGPYQFFSAFRNNELDYQQFYASIDEKSVSRIMADELEAAISSSTQTFHINRYVNNPGQEKRMNIFLIMVESLSAKYLGAYGNNEQLTPFLDKLANDSLWFTHFYATGTRTTRGLEAVTLSIPPTPGRSIVKRIGRESNMWSIGNVLKDKGYATRFLYGGRGYFENMNSFFVGNGYDITDQSTVPDEQIIFSNAWGMSDEDLYKQAIKEADNTYNSKKPFFFHLMTTSNHRPYTYPRGRIDIPPGQGRQGAVKYTDLALNDLFQKVKSKPWFDNTLFVIVADHNAGSAGKVSLPLKKYHIPLFIYSPKNIKATKIDTLSSQIDLAPTLLSLLNMDYRSAAFGKNILTTRPEKARALIANYQHLGLYDGNTTAILSPKRIISRQDTPDSDNPTVSVLEDTNSLAKRVISYYQTASRVYDNHLNAWPPRKTNHQNKM